MNERVCQLVEEQECTLVNEEQCNVVDKNECQIVTDTVKIEFQQFERFDVYSICRSVTLHMSKSAILCKRKCAKQLTMSNAPLLKKDNALSSTSASVRLCMTPRKYCK